MVMVAVMMMKMSMMVVKCSVNHRVIKPLYRKSLLTLLDVIVAASNPQTDYLDPDRKVKLLFWVVNTMGCRGLLIPVELKTPKSLLSWNLPIQKFDIPNCYSLFPVFARLN